MSKGQRLIVGLGNPGREYEETRHNIGFAVLDALAARSRATFQVDGRADAHVAQGRVRGRNLTLVKPQTYMNRSGITVKHLLRRYGLEPRDCLVIVDDLNLATGKLRLRDGGSAGGHNGVQDIIDRLGTDAFPRLRFGIGNAFERGQQVDYVLAPFDREEEEVVASSVKRATDAAITFVVDGLVIAMNRFN